MEITKIFNGKVITPNGIENNKTVLLKDGKIIDVINYQVDIPNAILIDAQQQFVSPGFIDIHLHGGGGHDFMDNTIEAFHEIAKIHAKYGTTSILPTTLTSPKLNLINTLETYKKASEIKHEGANLIGVHIEGPYFAMSQRGAQDPKFIRNPDPGEYNEILQSFPFVKRWSVAPELPGALEFGKILLKKGIIASIAHTEAVFSDVTAAKKVGFSLMTHLYSAMLGVTRINGFRHGGAVEAAFLYDDLDVEIIADGKHLPAELLQLIFKIKGAEKIALITDAMRAAGTKTKTSILGSKTDGLEVIIEDGVAKLPDRQSFAGSIATANQLVKNMIEMAGISLAEAVKMATETPARIMNLDKTKGKIAKNFDTDIIIFDENINIIRTIKASNPETP